LERTEPLFVTAVAADASFEMDTGPIAFKPTLMFQARTHAVTLRNTGMANLPFECDVFDPKQDKGARPNARDEKMYSVAPLSGVVAPGGAVELVVRFAPTEVYASCSRTLRVCFPGASADGARDTTVSLNGKALRPWCHFDLAESDYLTSGRRPAGEGSSLPEVSSATKVVQFASLGLGARVARRFEVLNPTSEAYEFFWEKTSNGSFGVESERDHSPFRCLTPRGVVAPGKRYEMAFEYAPAEGDAHERAFTFRAPSVGVSVPFLLAGAVTEPRVTLDTACVNFGKCLVGATRRESVTLVNHESVPFKFSFENLVSATYGVNSREVTFDPPSGTIGPLGEVRIAVAYKPTHEGSRSVNVALNVDRKPNKIRLNVKAETYAIREACALEQDADYGQSVAQGALPSAAPSGRPNIALAPAPARNAVSLGRVCVDDVATRRVSIANEGELTFEAEWSLGLNSRLSVSPEYFSVAPGERRVCEIAYRPNRTETLRESDAGLDRRQRPIVRLRHRGGRAQALTGVLIKGRRVRARAH
jgi:hydrocephalus-inducing protein